MNRYIRLVDDIDIDDIDDIDIDDIDDIDIDIHNGILLGNQEE